jgi:hypothetical protein
MKMEICSESRDDVDMTLAAGVMQGCFSLLLKVEFSVGGNGRRIPFLLEYLDWHHSDTNRSRLIDVPCNSRHAKGFLLSERQRTRSDQDRERARYHRILCININSACD